MTYITEYIKFTPTVHIVRRPDGWWLWDTTQGMNLSMKAKSQEQALADALTYYQERLSAVETARKELEAKINAITSIVLDPEEQGD